MADLNPELENVMRRVRKLLAIAGDDRANPEEAAAAASMAEKIMRKYQLAHADVVVTELKTRANVIEAPVFANMKRDDPKRTPLKKTPPWGQMLAVAIAQLHDCQVRLSWAHNKFGQSSSALFFQGYAPDVEVCAFTFDYIVGALIGGVADFNKQRKAEGNSSKVASESYRQGFTSSVIFAIQKMRAEKDAENLALPADDRAQGEEGSEPVAPSVSSRALALVDAKRAAIEEAFGEVKYVTKKSSAKVDYSAYSSGRKDGGAVDVNRRGIGGGQKAGALK